MNLNLNDIVPVNLGTSGPSWAFKELTISLSYLPDAFSKKAQNFTETWAQFKRRFENVKPLVLEDERQSPGFIRGHGTTESWPLEGGKIARASLLAIDGDKSRDTKTGENLGYCVPILDAKRALDEVGISYIIHTKHGHTPERPKWRALIPVDMDEEDLRACLYVFAAFFSRQQTAAAIAITRQQITTWNGFCCSHAWPRRMLNTRSTHPMTVRRPSMLKRSGLTGTNIVQSKGIGQIAGRRNRSLA